MRPPASNRNPWIIVAPALALALVAGCAAKKTVQTARDQARAVSVVRVEPRQIQGGLAASGALVPREDVAIFPQLTGYRISKVFVDVGSQVRAGQPLVQLDDVLLRAQLAQQVALAAQQRTMAAEANEQANRVKGLDNEGLLSKEQIDQRRFAATAAQAQARAQEAAANDMRTRERLTFVRAPFSGLVIERDVRFGDMSGSTTPLFRLARDSRVELAADVSEDALDKIHPGAAAMVTLANGSEVQGTVRLVSPAIDPSTKLGRVRIALPVRADIRAGGFASARFTGFTRSAIAVPETAVRYDAEGASVMVVGPDDRVARVPVSTGQRGGGYVELLTGPRDGSQVVERAGAMIVPGDYIRPVPAS
ncbi:MAG TPA: efflux RND transporter periplasmic adaptor subunit [Caulobacteraceae bacterium]|nr:efflux RND transporter periplasmic adaptor subunit [Caulobacteraceae bacterium]